MNKILIALFSAAFFLGLATRSVSACVLVEPFPSVSQKYADSDLVVIATVISVTNGPGEQTVEFQVRQTFKGKPASRIFAHQPRTNCDPDFIEDIGNTFLLYLAGGPNGLPQRVIAALGGRFDREKEDLLWLKKLPGALDRTRIAGTVSVYQEQPFAFVKAVAGVKVRIFNSKNSFEVTTDENGVYEVWDLPPGKYQIEPELPQGLGLNFTLDRGRTDWESPGQDGDRLASRLKIVGTKGSVGRDFVLKVN